MDNADDACSFGMVLAFLGSTLEGLGIPLKAHTSFCHQISRRKEALRICLRCWVCDVSGCSSEGLQVVKDVFAGKVFGKLDEST